MRISHKASLLAVCIGVLGIGSGVRAIAMTPTQSNLVAQARPATDNDKINTPADATNEAGERDREVQDDKVPAALTNVGSYGETIYDMAKVGDWTKASTNLSLLQKAAKSLPSEIDRQPVAQLNGTIASLSGSITTKNQPATLHQANQITLIAANMTKEFQPKVPVQVTLLDYYGREFEIGSANRDVAQLQKTTNGFRQTWNTLRPAVQARNPGEAKTFDNIVAQVQAAKSPDQYGRLATPVLNAVDNLEKVFK